MPAGWQLPQTVKDFEISWQKLDWLARLNVLIVDEVSMLRCPRREAAQQTAWRARPSGLACRPSLLCVAEALAATAS